MSTERIYRTALMYAKIAGIEFTAANMGQIIKGMRAELRALAEEYDAHGTPAPRTYSLAEIRNGTGWPTGARFALVEPAATPRAVAQVAEEYVFMLRLRDDGTRWPVGTKLYALEEPTA